jgi:hypothetical protein
MARADLTLGRVAVDVALLLRPVRRGRRTLQEFRVPERGAPRSEARRREAVHVRLVRARVRSDGARQAASSEQARAGGTDAPEKKAVRDERNRRSHTRYPIYRQST